ncbi:MAG: response regulator [Nitrospirae bacterium]|nr:MAG: response regulator [Nitrospirota bacterium]
MTIVLVIDDEPLICDLLRIVLGRHGYEVHTASSGREGIESFRELRPRFTFLDLRLPDMNGMEVLKKIRQVDPHGAVMILTAAASENSEQQARDLGVTDFLIKGLPVEALLGAVQQTTRGLADAAAPTSTGAAGTRIGAGTTEHSILIVDDEQAIRYWLTHALTERGHRVRAAQDGSSALAQVEFEQPDLVVLDMHMPGMSGVELIRRLRAQKYTGRSMMLTGSHEERLMKEVLDLGGVDVVSKAADPERIILAIEARLALT